jgi:hypothetical protein
MRDFYTRPPYEQDLVISNLPWCHRHQPTNFIEYEEDGLITVEGECPECGRVCKAQFRSVRDLP